MQKTEAMPGRVRWESQTGMRRKARAEEALTRHRTSGEQACTRFLRLGGHKELEGQRSQSMSFWSRRSRSTDVVHPIVEHELDPCVGEDPQQGRHVALQQPSNSPAVVDVLNREVQTPE